MQDEVEDAVTAGARLGYAARGVLYGVVGILAVQIAFRGGSGSDASAQGAMAAVASQPFGAVLVAVLGLGLAGYAVQRALQAVRGGAPGDEGIVRRRLLPAGRAVVNAGLSLLAWRQVFSGSSSSGSSGSGSTLRVLELPGGPFLVGGVGVAVVVVGLAQVQRAWRGEVHELAVPERLPRRGRRRARALGRAGYTGRGVAFLVAGGFLVRTAVTHDPGSGNGLDGALQELVDTPVGVPVLLAVALGLLLFGAHCLLEAAIARGDAVPT